MTHLGRLAVRACRALAAPALAILLASAPALAQTPQAEQPGSTPAAAASAPAAPSATPPVTPSSSPVASPATGEAPAREPKPSEPAAEAPPLGDPKGVKTIEIASRPALVFNSVSTWDDSYASLTSGLERLQAEAARVGLTPAGKPIAVFVSTDDEGFRFDAMLPLAQKPASEPQLGAAFKLGETPSGRAVKFEHRGAYEEIDATYEAITAWLDDKGLESRDFFVEEYLDQGKGADDTALAVDVYVFVKP